MPALPVPSPNACQLDWMTNTAESQPGFQDQLRVQAFGEGRGRAGIVSFPLPQMTGRGSIQQYPVTVIWGCGCA